jgi:hypothetical protein
MEGLNKELTSKLEESRELNERLVDMVGAEAHFFSLFCNHHRLIHFAFIH